MSIILENILETTFIFFNKSSAFSAKNPESLRNIQGDDNIFF